MKVIRPLIAAFAISFSGMICTTATAQAVLDENFRIAEEDFVTPEAAFRHFVDSVKANDLAAALQAYAVNEYADGYDFKAMTERLAAISPAYISGPSQYQAYDQINRIGLLAEKAILTRNFIYSFNIPVPLDQTSPVSDSAEIDAFVTAVDPMKLSGLTVVEIDQLVMSSEQALKAMKAQVAPIGADEYTELFVLYELDGRYFSGGLHLLNFGGNWKIERLNSVYAATVAHGGVEQTSPEEFQEKVREMSEGNHVIVQKIAP